MKKSTKDIWLEKMCKSCHILRRRKKSEVVISKQLLGWNFAPWRLKKNQKNHREEYKRVSLEKTTWKSSFLEYKMWEVVSYYLDNEFHPGGCQNEGRILKTFYILVVMCSQILTHSSCGWMMVSPNVQQMGEKRKILTRKKEGYTSHHVLRKKWSEVAMF